MIKMKITNCRHENVTVNYNDKEKSCVCDCGNSWVPQSFNDFKCSECEEG